MKKILPWKEPRTPDEKTPAVDIAAVDTAASNTAASNTAASNTPASNEDEEVRRPKGKKVPQRGPKALTNLPKEQRPRERMITHGEKILSDEELVAVLLRTGKPGQSAIQMAGELLKEHGGVGGLLWTDLRRMRRYGLGPAKAATIMAAVELGRRLTRAGLSRGNLMDRPEVVSRYLYLRYGRVDQEVMGALFLDMQNHLISESEIFRGTLTRAAVEPRAILREALLAGAAALLIFHTHPKGDPAPSQEDLEFTLRMVHACELMGIRLMDHMVVGDRGAWVSLKSRGAW